MENLQAFQLTKKQKRYMVFKRALDLVFSGIGLIVFFPLAVLIMIVIKCDSQGPVFFKQTRIGKDKSHFEIWKFRSMRADALQNVPTHLLEDPEKYITKVGRFLRKSSLDELPQLINIFKGEMSFVGPRPALWNQYDLIEERDKYGAHEVLPGLTGLAQINGRDTLEISTKAMFDGKYVKDFGFRMDMHCFWGTFEPVIRRKDVIEGIVWELDKEAVKKDEEKNAQ